MKNVMQKTMAIVLAAVVLAFAWAAGPAMAAGLNASISSAGILTWSAVAGADQYWLGIDGSSKPAEGFSVDLKKEIEERIETELIQNTGTHTIVLEAYSSATEEYLETWTKAYHYTSSGSPESAPEPIKAEIKDGILKWQVYPGAVSYQYGVEDTYMPAEGLSVKIDEVIDQWIAAGTLEKTGTYKVEINALDETPIIIQTWSKDYAYASSASGPSPLTAAIKDGVLSWSAYPGAGSYSYGVDGKYKTTTALSVDIHARITELVKAGEIANSGKHTISLEAYTPDQATKLKSWSQEYAYTVPAEALEPSAPAEPEDPGAPAEPEEPGSPAEPQSPAVTDAPGSDEPEPSVPAAAMLTGDRFTVSVGKAVYTGKALEPAVAVTDQNTGAKLTQGRDYTLSFTDNRNVGTGTVTVQGNGNYTGTISQTFTIQPKAVSLSKLSSGRAGTLTVKWKKGRGQLTGYQMEYSQKKNFSGSKKVTIKARKTVSRTIKGLKKGKTYYVRLRTWHSVNGKKIYSDWSRAKKIRIKK